MNENNTNCDILIKKGILTSKNEISQDKINLISGAMTAPLLETIWTFSGFNIEGINRISDIFRINKQGRRVKLISTDSITQEKDIVRIDLLL